MADDTPTAPVVELGAGAAVAGPVQPFKFSSRDSRGYVNQETRSKIQEALSTYIGPTTARSFLMGLADQLKIAKVLKPQQHQMLYIEGIDIASRVLAWVLAVDPTFVYSEAQSEAKQTVSSGEKSGVELAWESIITLLGSLPGGTSESDNNPEITQGEPAEPRRYTQEDFNDEAILQLLASHELVRVRPVGAGLVELVDGVTWSLTDTGRAALAADVKTTDEDAYTTAQSTSNIDPSMYVPGKGMPFVTIQSLAAYTCKRGIGIVKDDKLELKGAGSETVCILDYSQYQASDIGKVVDVMSVHGLGVPCADNAFVFEPVVACELGLCPKFYGGSVHATIIVKVYPEVKKVTYMESLLIDMARRSYIGTGLQGPPTAAELSAYRKETARLRGETQKPSTHDNLTSSIPPGDNTYGGAYPEGFVGYPKAAKDTVSIPPKKKDYSDKYYPPPGQASYVERLKEKLGGDVGKEKISDVAGATVDQDTIDGVAETEGVVVSDAEDTSSDDTFPQAKLVNGSYTWSGDAGGSGTGLSSATTTDKDAFAKLRDETHRLLAAGEMSTSGSRD